MPRPHFHLSAQVNPKKEHFLQNKTVRGIVNKSICFFSPHSTLTKFQAFSMHALKSARRLLVYSSFGKILTDTILNQLWYENIRWLH